jgi:hypothetical protein
MLCGLMGGYQSFRGIYRLYLQDHLKPEGHSKHFDHRENLRFHTWLLRTDSWAMYILFVVHFATVFQ